MELLDRLADISCYGIQVEADLLGWLNAMEERLRRADP
jgi:hypothetical protein